MEAVGVPRVVTYDGVFDAFGQHASRPKAGEVVDGKPADPPRAVEPAP